MSNILRRTKESLSNTPPTTFQDDDDPANEVQNWFRKTPQSIGTLRLLLCTDLTVVQGALLSSWAFVAWVLGLNTVDLHDLAVYGGIFCVQYLLITILRLFYVFIDGWNQVQTEKITLSAAKRPLDIAVNILGRLFIWLLLMGVALFSGFQLRVLPMHSFINCVISGCSFGNFVLLLHTSGAILTDCDNYSQTSKPQPEQRRQSRGVVVRMSIGIWTVIIQMALAGCRALHLASHLWPLADTMLVSCLVALGVYMARRSLDEAWFSSGQVQQARIVAQESRHLIWPVVLLLMSYVCDVIMAILKLTQEYALRFLVSVSNIGNEKNKLSDISDLNVDEISDTISKENKTREKGLEIDN